jgi:hypothetical protein
MQLLLLFEADVDVCARAEMVSANNGAMIAASDATEIEELVEADSALAPIGLSPLMVEPVLLDPREVAALLDNLVPMLEASANIAAIDAATDSGGSEGVEYESDPQASGRSGGHSKLSPFAWLFSDYAGAGRSARHQQGHYLRARRGFGKKARPSPQQAQGSLFGDCLR